MEEWQDPNVIALWFFIVLTFVFLLTVAIIVLVRSNSKRIVRNKMRESKLALEHKNELLKTSIEVQERERDRIAADLHDALIGNLTAIGIMNQVEHKPEDLNKLIQESIQTARRISHDLSPPLLEHTSLSDLIRDKTTPWEQNNTLTYYHDIRYDGKISNETKIQIIRIVQELMNNIYKHAKATKTQIHLRLTPNLLCLNIKDNGKGFNVNTSKHGLGMKNLEMRVHYLNGNYRLKSKKGTGSTALFIINPSNY